MTPVARPRSFAFALGLAVASTTWLAVLLVEARRPGTSPGAASGATSEARADVMRALVAEGQGIWDGHADPDVGRLLQPGLVDRAAGRIRVDSNALGLREREIAIPKPPGRVRVVLLGDSYVFGNGVAAEERCGVHLEREMRARAALDVEVLHVGITDWDAATSATFLRRRLHALEPDLVVHVLIYNDLDDPSAARGFGATAQWTARHRRHADGLVYTRQPYVMGFGDEGAGQSLLNAGLDHESRTRYAAAREAIAALRDELEARGARYFAVLHWPDHTAVAARELLAGLPAAMQGFVPSSVFRDGSLRISLSDAHWNPRGHVAVAEALYGWIAERGLLAPRVVPQWEAALARARAWDGEGRAEASAPFDVVAFRGGEPLRSRIDFTALDVVAASQVHGGIDGQGRVSPYASLVLANDGATRLRVVAEPLPGIALRGTCVVSVEGEPVGRFALAEASGAHELSLPDALREREYLNLVLECDDWLHAGASLERCVALRLLEVALVDAAGEASR